MDYDEAVTEFLSQPENFRLGLEIAERMGEVKRQIEVHFWHMCFGKLRERVASGEWPAAWSPGIDEDDQLPRDGYGVLLVPQTCCADAPVLKYYLTNWSTGTYALYARVCLGPNDDLSHLLTEGVDEFRRRMHKDHGYGYTKFSATWQDVTRYEGLNTFLLDVVDRSDELAEQSVETLLTLFTDSVEGVEAINRTLAASRETAG